MLLNHQVVKVILFIIFIVLCFTISWGIGYFHPTILGFMAAICTTLAFIPQVIHIAKTKETKGISAIMYIVLVFGLFAWVIYGLSNGDLPVILANSITLVSATVILGFKIFIR